MRMTKTFLFIVAFCLLLVGCAAGNSNENLAQEDVINKAKESFESLNSLSQESNMNFDFVLNNQKEIQKIKVEGKMNYDENQNISTVHTSTKTTKGNESVTFDFYKDPESMYVNQGNGWVSYNSSEDYSSTYKPTLDSFLDVASKMEMVENETNYEFTYNGKDGNVFRTIGKPYNISYTGISNDDIDLKLMYVVEKEGMFLKDLEINTHGALDDNNQITIEVDTEFDDFNDLDEIEKPEVIKTK